MFGDMIHVFLIVSAAILAMLGAGCTVACGPVRSPPPQQLRLDTNSPTDYGIRVVGCGEPIDLMVPADGCMTFKVPVGSRHCTQYLLGMRVHSPTPIEKRRVIYIVRGEKVVRKFSAVDIEKMPTDSRGFHVLKIEP